MNQTTKNKLIKRIVEVAYKAKEGHIPSSLSILDILYVLYDKFINENSHFILSKGHASLGLYTILEHFNLLEDNLDDFCKFNSNLGGHPTNKIKNIQASTGSLGHGLPMAVGLALSEKIKGTNNKVYCIIGDGETNEGTIWESALLAANHKLDNLIVILDYNHSNDRALKLNDIKHKFKSFGWETIEINGHDENGIKSALLDEVNDKNKPIIIISYTIKGNGVEMMENNPEWHHKTPNEEEYNKIINVLFEKDFNYIFSTLQTIGQTNEEARNLAFYLETTDKIDGNIAEVGVYAGDTATILNYHKNNKKKLYLFDTFEGLKDCENKDGDYLQNGFFEYNYDEVNNKFKDDKSVELIKGYFPESVIKEVNDSKFSFIHLDVDTYQSTLNCLNYFYDKISKGGIIIIHDYQNNEQTKGVGIAVNEFLSDKPETVKESNTTQGIIIKL